MIKLQDELMSAVAFFVSFTMYDGAKLYDKKVGEKIV